jgi:hypothetical protein
MRDANNPGKFMTICIQRASGLSLAWTGRALLALSCLAVAAFALLAQASHAQAAFRQLPDGRIAIDLSPAFARSDRFPGFADKSTGASFAVVDLPANAYDKLKTIPDSQEALANEGFSGTEKAELPGRKGTFFYLVGKQKAPGGDVTKFVLIFAESDVTGVIVVTVPQAAIDAGTYSRESIEAILSTATVRETPPTASSELFLFGYLGPFKEAFDHGGMTKAYSISGAQAHPGENRLIKEPMLMVSSSIHGDAIDAKAEAYKTFAQLGGIKERRIDVEKEMKIGDLNGYQINGEVTDAASGNKIAIDLVLLTAKPFGYFIFLGSIPVADKEKMLPEIEKVIASFALVK